MKNYILTTLFLIVLYINANAQTPYASVKTKEYYDAIFERIYNGNIVDKPQKYNEGSNTNDFGDGGSYVLFSLLTMYESTGDKSYLFRFIDASYHTIELRNHERFNNPLCASQLV